MLCQPEVGFEVELDVASIWERLSMMMGSNLLLTN